MTTIKITVDVESAKRTFLDSLSNYQEKIDNALATTVSMIATMMEIEFKKDIGGAGNFGGRWIAGLHVDVAKAGNGYEITTTHEIPYASIFEEGGTISGRPLLWIGLSGTDAEGVAPSSYGDRLFSAQGSRGTPLLFSVSDRKPKYFGTPSVKIPKKFHLREVQTRVLSNFQATFDANMRGA